MNIFALGKRLCRIKILGIAKYNFSRKLMCLGFTSQVDMVKATSISENMCSLAIFEYLAPEIVVESKMLNIHSSFTWRIPNLHKLHGIKYIHTNRLSIKCPSVIRIFRPIIYFLWSLVVSVSSSCRIANDKSIYWATFEGNSMAINFP